MANYTKISGIATGDVVKVSGIANADIVKFGGITRASVATNDWISAMWFSSSTDNNLTSSQNDWDNEGIGYNSRRQFGIDATNQKSNMQQTFVPFLDTSGDTKYLKFIYEGLNTSTQEQFHVQLTGGQRVLMNGGNNPDLTFKSDTGIAFDPDTGNLVEGEHVIYFIWKHVPAKGSILYRASTCVMSCSNNVIKFAYKATNTSIEANANYYTPAATMASPLGIKPEFTYTPGTNTWALSVTDTYGDVYSGSWHGGTGFTEIDSSSSFDNTNPTVGYLTKRIRNTQTIAATASAWANEREIWWFKTGIE